MGTTRKRGAPKKLLKAEEKRKLLKSSYEKECEIAYNLFKKERNLEEEIPNAVFELDIILPDKPKDFKKIPNYGLPKKKRNFPYYSKEFKYDMDIAYDQINLGEKADPSFDIQIDWTKYPDMVERFNIHGNDQTRWDEFMIGEFKKCKEGFWWYNGDNLEYVTGYHYFILQYMIIPNDVKGTLSNPEFLDMIRDRHYAVKRLMDDPDYSGIAYLGCRRSGKTLDGIGIGYFDTITQRNAGLFTIQSKSHPDAKKVFGKLIKMWKKLPKIFKPEDTGDSNPVSGLYFDNTRTRSTARTAKEYYDVLEAAIVHYASNETAIDGERTTFQFVDEYGKNTNCNVWELLQVNKVCCFSGTDIIGFMYWATTVEEMDKRGGRNAKKVWDMSDPNNLTGNQRTHSTMGRLFFPAYYGMFDGKDKVTGKRFVDEWGYSDMELSKAWLDREEKGKSNEDLNDFRRKYPQSVSDCFRSAESDNGFNKERLRAHEIYNAEFPDRYPILKGNFFWKNNIPLTEVVFDVHPQGRWELIWIPPSELRNKVKINTTTGNYEPLFDNSITSLDPFAAAKVKDTNRASKAAMLTITSNAEFSAPTVVCKYLYRHDDPNKMYEDSLLQSWFYSSPFMPERNVRGVLDWYREKGLYDFIMYDPFTDNAVDKDIRGIQTTNGNTIDTMINYAMTYISQHVGADENNNYNPFSFNDLIKDLIMFEPNNRTEYDLSMAFLIGITAVYTKRRRIADRQAALNHKWDSVGAWV